jgi:hypothetical protein
MPYEQHHTFRLFATLKLKILIDLHGGTFNVVRAVRWKLVNGISERTKTCFTV